MRLASSTLEKAYAMGIGAWDKAAIKYGYAHFRQAMRPRVWMRCSNKMRPTGCATLPTRIRGHWAARIHTRIFGITAPMLLPNWIACSPWTAALDRFGENAIRVGEPMSELEETLVPLYMLHRYQTEAAAKLIGGLDYRYAVRGDGHGDRDAFSGRQRKALAAVLQTIEPEVLTLPDFCRFFRPSRRGIRAHEEFRSLPG